MKTKVNKPSLPPYGSKLHENAPLVRTAIPESVVLGYDTKNGRRKYFSAFPNGEGPARFTRTEDEAMLVPINAFNDMLEAAILIARAKPKREIFWYVCTGEKMLRANTGGEHD